MTVSAGAYRLLPFGKLTSTLGFFTVIVSPVLTKVVLLSSVDEVASLLALRRSFEGWVSTFSSSITCEEFAVTGSEVTEFNSFIWTTSSFLATGVFC